MRKRNFVLAAAAFALATAAYAGSQNDAGCGWGSMLFKENTPAQQIVAATTNGTFGNQTFGITTGTGGCTSGGLIKTSQARRSFVAANFRALQRQMAAGKGETVASLGSLMGCGTQTARFGAFTKSHYEQLFPAGGTTPDALLKNLTQQMGADASISQTCAL